MKTIQDNLSRYRNEIKGLAILWVVLFHADLGLHGVARAVQAIGYGGVDILLFLLGYGLYHSLSRDGDTGRFWLRRAKRLLPSYLPFCLLWLVVMVPMYKEGLATSLRIIAGNLTMVAYLANVPQRINWYMSALLLTLMVAPLFYACLKEGKQYWLRAALLFACLFLLGLTFISNDLYMIFSRLPVFALGMVFAKPVERQKTNPVLWLTVGCLLGLAALYICFTRYVELLNDYAMYWHPFVLIAPALCTGLGFAFSHLPKRALVPLSALGRASFEIFLFNAWVEVLGKKFDLINGRKEWLLWSLGGIAAGLLYHLVVQKTQQLFQIKKNSTAAR